jgi:hypothetical protein
LQPYVFCESRVTVWCTLKPWLERNQAAPSGI